MTQRFEEEPPDVPPTFKGFVAYLRGDRMRIVRLVVLLVAFIACVALVVWALT